MKSDFSFLIPFNIYIGKSLIAYHVVLIIDAKTLAEIPEYHGTILLEFKVARHIFPASENVHYILT